MKTPIAAIIMLAAASIASTAHAQNPYSNSGAGGWYSTPGYDPSPQTYYTPSLPQPSALGYSDSRGPYYGGGGAGVQYNNHAYDNR